MATTGRTSAPRRPRAMSTHAQPVGAQRARAGSRRTRQPSCVRTGARSLNSPVTSAQRHTSAAAQKRLDLALLSLHSRTATPEGARANQERLLCLFSLLPSKDRATSSPNRPSRRNQNVSTCCHTAYTSGALDILVSCAEPAGLKRCRKSTPQLSRAGRATHNALAIQGLQAVALRQHGSRSQRQHHARHHCDAPRDAAVAARML